jgi:hypothetical protein
MEEWMTNRENALAVLRYEPYDRVPLVHFGFWPETVAKWHKQGHLSDADVAGWDYGSPAEARVAKKAGFDFGWGSAVGGNAALFPPFERRVLETAEDGSRKTLNEQGVVILEKPGVVSIPMEIEHLLKGRPEWEEHFKARLQYGPERIDVAGIERVRAGDPSGGEDGPIGIWCGSLYGQIRDILGVEGMSYLAVDDEGLYAEIIETVGRLCLRVVEETLAAAGDFVFDYGHFWEDICFKNGPLISPSVFSEMVGPWYARITALLASRGTGIVSLDCDGWIDALIPTWLENGVNTMFPIEVGTWEGSIGPWRAKYGHALLGVGGMNKVVFSRDRVAIDAEIERLRPLVEAGGYLPCPDHRIAPDAEWDNILYYCDRFRELF